jgi:E3 ubiquitin-protein transferase RMND5
MDSVNHQLAKLKKRLHNSRIQVSGVFDKVISKLSELESKSESLEDEVLFSEISRTFDEIQQLEPMSKVIEEHRETYSHISRLNKECDLLFKTNLEDLQAHKAEKFDPSTLDSLISNYLLSQGLFDQARLISQKDYIESAQLSKIYETLALIEQGDLDSALLTASEVKIPCRNVMFCIHKLRYLAFLKSNQLQQAFEYARNNLQQFADTHIEEIKHLMGSCLFVNDPGNSHYKSLFTEAYVQETLKEILAEWSKASEIPTNSPLETIVRAGDQVAAELVPIASIAGDKFWSSPMPTELRLENELRFHSTFVCPVSKEVATGENPPILLPCGHLIAKNTMDRLLATTIRAKFKCPTCPTEVTEKETKRIYI